MASWVCLIDLTAHAGQPTRMILSYIWWKRNAKSKFVWIDRTDHQSNTSNNSGDADFLAERSLRVPSKLWKKKAVFALVLSVWAWLSELCATFAAKLIKVYMFPHKIYFLIRSILLLLPASPILFILTSFSTHIFDLIKKILICCQLFFIKMDDLLSSQIVIFIANNLSQIFFLVMILYIHTLLTWNEIIYKKNFKLIYLTN